MVTLCKTCLAFENLEKIFKISMVLDAFVFFLRLHPEEGKGCPFTGASPFSIKLPMQYSHLNKFSLLLLHVYIFCLFLFHSFLCLDQFPGDKDERQVYSIC